MNTNSNDLETLEKLGNLFKSGALSKEEFETLKNELLRKTDKNTIESQPSDIQNADLEKVTYETIEAIKLNEAKGNETIVHDIDDVKPNYADSYYNSQKNVSNLDDKNVEEKKAEPSPLTYLSVENDGKPQKKLYIVLGSLLLLILGGIIWYRFGSSSANSEELAAREKAKADSIALYSSNFVQQQQSNIPIEPNSLTTTVDEPNNSNEINNESSKSQNGNESSNDNSENLKIPIVGKKYEVNIGKNGVDYWTNGYLVKFDTNTKKGVIIQFREPFTMDYSATMKRLEFYNCRLPSIEEMKLIIKIKELKSGGYTSPNDFYWTTTKDNDDKVAVINGHGEIKYVNESERCVYFRLQDFEYNNTLHIIE